MEELFVVKIGGNIIDNPAKLKNFLNDFSQLKGRKILIHGGGKIATEISKKLNIETQMVEGRRITDEETLKVVTMVYAGLINKNIVATLQSLNSNAIGLTGADANTIPSTKRKTTTIDYGFVGDPVSDTINTDYISTTIEKGITPVFCAITHDEKGSLLNTNADTIASVLAVALSKVYSTSLLYCFEKKGVLKDINDENSVINEIDEKTYPVLKDEGTISQGMIPKIDNAFNAIRSGVNSVYICDADDLGAIINNKEKKGTRIFKG